jgi:hypothetical protein
MLGFLASATTIGGAMSDKPNKTRAWLSCLPLLLAGFGASRQLASWPVRLRYPGEVNVAEGMALVEIQHLRRGLPVYASASPERFDRMVYGPLYFLLGARLINPQAPAFWPLRLLSLPATLGLAAACALLAFWLGRSYLAAALAALLFLSYAFVTLFGVSARPDTVAVFLSFLGFLAAYRFRDSRKLLLAAPLMLLGFYYKPQFVAGPLAVLLYLVMEKHYRRAAEFATTLAAGGMGLLLLFQLVVFRGQEFFLHFVIYNRVRWDRVHFLWSMAILGVFLGVPMLLAAEFLRSHPNRLLSCYMGCALFLGVLTVGKTGSSVQYFFELLLIVAVLMACLVAERLGTQAAEVLVFLVMVVFLGQLLAPPPPRAGDFSQDQAIQDFLRRHFAPHTPSLGFYTGDLTRADLEVPISDVSHYIELTRQATLPDQDLQNQIAHHRFGLIVVSLRLRTPEDCLPTVYDCTVPLARAMLENYRPLTSLALPSPERNQDDFRFYVWVPK